jgi:hypothetical protein
MADHLVKLFHARDLAHWKRLPAYEEHTGKTLAQHRTEVKARDDLGSKLWRLIDAKRMVDAADNPSIYRTTTASTPWPISLPSRGLP